MHTFTGVRITDAEFAAPEPRRIHVYFANVSPLNDDTRYEACLGQLSQTRQTAADRFRLRKDKNLCVGAGMLLDRGLREYGLREAEMRCRKTEHGKPYFVDHPNIFFNISHSGDRAMVCLADCEVGCDIEKMREENLDLARRFFCPGEYASILEQETPARQKRQFYRLWTLKESFMKVTGLGMALPLNEFEISLTGERISVVQSVSGTVYSFAEFDVFYGYRSALCCAAPSAETVCETVDLSEYH